MTSTVRRRCVWQVHLLKCLIPCAAIVALVEVNHATAQCDAWQPVGAGMVGPEVNALTVFNGELIAAGFFFTADGLTVNSIARWNGTTWQALGSGIMTGGLPGTVDCLTLHNGELIAGGAFATAGGQSANGIAAWNGSTWHALGAGISGGIRALASYNNVLYAGGAFGIRQWDGALWVNVGMGITGGAQTVHAMTIYGSELVVGGLFTTAGGQAASNVARWNGAIWQPLGLGTGGHVFALSVHGGELIVGGNFGIAGGASANRIARWNGASWQSPSSFGVNNTVWALTTYDDELIAGGDFTVAGVQAANRIARWNGTVWEAKSSGFDNSVFAIGTYGTELFAGGNFSAAGGQTANRIAKWQTCAKPCPADVAPGGGDGTVNITDLLAVIAAWGPSGGGGPADVNGDNTVNIADLLAVIAAWGACP